MWIFEHCKNQNTALQQIESCYNIKILIRIWEKQIRTFIELLMKEDDFVFPVLKEITHVKRIILVGNGQMVYLQYCNVITMTSLLSSNLS